MSDAVKTTKEKINPADIPVPDELPVLPLSGFVFFPGMGFPLQVNSPSSQKLIEEVMEGNRLAAIVTTLKPRSGESTPDSPQLSSTGVVGYVHKLVKIPDGNYQVLMSSLSKIRIGDYTQHEPYMKAKVVPVEMLVERDKEIDAYVMNLGTQFRHMVEMANLPAELATTLTQFVNPFHSAYLVISQLGLPFEEEQKFLEIKELKKLLRSTTLELTKRLDTMEMSNEIQQNIKEDIDSKQREFFLRQQLKAIKKELGEDDENVELTELKKKAAEASLSKEAREAVDKELNRLARISPSSPEYTVSRNYLDWLLDLPWEESSEDSLDLAKAQQILDEDHYGLEKIKKRIIEFLAVRKLKKDMHGPILCFSGPPGVGKTSLGQSIARSMGRKFVRISLGGVRDEAEIRGHRRTYIGALPGRIIQSLRKAGTNNPLFMLDEIDKLGMDFRGDPSSALLEVLDPEQNFTFADHYLEVVFDLSKVMFITTANYMENIPGPLRDRMEMIELSGYTEEEKLNIAKDHLVAKQLEAHALSKDDLLFEDDAVRTIIRSYTREAGVRNLERRLGGICRGVARDIVMGETPGQVTITPGDVEKYLGPIQFFSEFKVRSWGPGLATGLAWTPVGGVLLFIETAKMAGKGRLILTGKLGDVMKESATAALTYIRSKARELGINQAVFETSDLHIHVPEGAVPKDGPSAGVAIAVSLTSLLTGVEVKKTVAMTGEITLRGDVLPVGGVKEKTLAAIRAGIKQVVLPSLNKKDVAEIPEEIRKKVTIYYVKHISEALNRCLEKTKA